ncbi:unnamed protein product [Lactuca virosa]|uniref:Uncharacterized protein n=1 Tax=Lactuca virosa TaxID=75947 RepID=A0AAU9PJD6_9ASTR|nr:unnamed protein product [Lactuca virosa]
MMAEVARGHGGDGGDRPPHRVARGVPSGCQSFTRSKLLHTSAHGCRFYAQRRHLEDKMGLKPQHMEGWRQMRYKEGSGWCTNRVQEDWEKIQEEYEKMKNEEW